MKSSPTPDFSLWQNFLLLAGRVLMGWIFVESGWRKLFGMDAFIASLANRRVPYASVLGWIGAAAELFGGVALLRGAARPRAEQQSHFAKNVTIIGGFLLLLVT